jgi:hypothetical protein
MIIGKAIIEAKTSLCCFNSDITSGADETGTTAAATAGAGSYLRP